jgi:glycosyltransferase involved in cell wall biosynthesis
MKILLVSLNGDDNSGGVERVVYYLNKILSEHYSVFIKQRTVKLGLFDKIVYPFLFSLELFFIKNKFVISNSWQSFLYPADLSIHHGTTAGYLKAIQGHSKKSRFLAWMEKKSAKTAKRVIAVSKNCEQELELYYGIPKDKVIVLNNFVDEHLFYPGSEEAHDAVRILFSGRLEERKGLSRLIDLAGAIENESGFELSLAVNSPVNCELFWGMRHVTIYKNLSIPEMRQFYAAGDVLYFPSQYEGFSMATLEALSSGIPVIGSRFAVPVELQNYDFVQVFEHSDILELLKNVTGLYKKYRGKRKDIHEIIAKDFGYDQYKEKLLSIITGAIG